MSPIGVEDVGQAGEPWMLGTTAPVVRQHAHGAYEQLRTALDPTGWKESDNDESWGAAPVRA